jgi:vancomycin resistance protein YoaR
MIEKRYNHSKWYAKYYSPYIYGDDASLYEMIKQLQIKNIGKHPIYFKKLTISPNNILLVSILPYKTSDKVVIFKKQLGKLQAVS